MSIILGRSGACQGFSPGISPVPGTSPSGKGGFAPGISPGAGFSPGILFCPSPGFPAPTSGPVGASSNSGLPAAVAWPDWDAIFECCCRASDGTEVRATLRTPGSVSSTRSVSTTAAESAGRCLAAAAAYARRFAVYCGGYNVQRPCLGRPQGLAAKAALAASIGSSP